MRFPPASAYLLCAGPRGLEVTLRWQQNAESQSEVLEHVWRHVEAATGREAADSDCLDLRDYCISRSTLYLNVDVPTVLCTLAPCTVAGLASFAEAMTTLQSRTARGPSNTQTSLLVGCSTLKLRLEGGENGHLQAVVGGPDFFYVASLGGIPGAMAASFAAEHLDVTAFEHSQPQQPVVRHAGRQLAISALHAGR